MGYLGPGYGDLGPSRDHGLEGRFWGQMRSILGPNEVNSRPILGNLIETVMKALHLAVGRALRLEYD